ncbi:MAG: hypothetical protein QME25_03600 [Bacteroidota bacterium]|nr:hypothetical protein [Bacteroidota bacterium]
MLRNTLNNYYLKRFRSVIITLIAVFAVNTAISFAGGDSGRASIATAIEKETSRPKAISASFMPKDTPRPKAIGPPAPINIPRP